MKDTMLFDHRATTEERRALLAARHPDAKEIKFVSNQSWTENMDRLSYEVILNDMDAVYEERNKLALFIAIQQNMVAASMGSSPPSGWYLDTREDFKGWSRVISIGNGTVTYHVPDEMDLGNLPEIKNNWDGHTTEMKYGFMDRVCGVKSK